MVKYVILWKLAALAAVGCLCNGNAAAVPSPSAEDGAWAVKVVPGADLNAVRDRIRAWRAEKAMRAQAKVTVELAQGRYELSAPITLGPRDSHVTWIAAPGAEVRVAGGLLVTTAPEPVVDREILDLLPEKARSKVVAYDLHKLGIDDWGDYLYNFEDDVQRRVANTWGQGEFTMGSHPPPPGQRSSGRLELFVDDRPLTVARSAAGTFYHVDRLLGKVFRKGPGKGIDCAQEAWFTVKEALPASWAKEPDLHVCGCWCRDWAEQHQRVVALDLSTRTLKLSRPWHQYCYTSGAYFYGFNLLSELDEPGEWYVHRKTGKLVVYLPDGGARRVELSRASRLFELTGAKDVVFRGLVFETCRNSALRMKDCTDCRVEACTIRNVGQHALIVEDGERCGARGCRFYGMGGGGVWLADGNRATLKPSGHFVEDCDIHDFGRWNRMYRPGVCLSGVGMRAERNRIHDSPHAAVLYFGCNLLMRSNEVYRVCGGSKDCGAFYTGRSWMLRGNKIVGNYIHDVIGLGGAPTRTIYLDDSVAQVEIVGNRFERCTWAIFIGGARECVVTNNVFVDCPGAIYVDKRGMNWQKPHIDGRLRELAAKGTVYGLSCRQGPYVDAFPAVKDLPGPHPYEPVKNVIAHNRFVRGEAEWIGKYAPKRANDPRWWRDGDVTDAELRAWGVFADNAVDNASLTTAR